MERTFIIDYILDDAGVAEYHARRKEDFDKEGIPYPDSFFGVGENELYALIELLDRIAMANEYEEEQSIH